MKIKLSASVLCLSAMMLVVQPVSASVQTSNTVLDKKEHFKYSDLLEADDVMYLAERARTYAETHPQANLDGAAYNPQIDKTMDLTNNYRGREIGINNGILPRYYVSSLLPKVMAAVDAGKMIIIVNNQLVSSNSSGKL
jgi:hypothetical protein